MTIKPYIGPSQVYGDKAFTFEGASNISFVCLNQTNKIVLHIKDLQIKSAKLYKADFSQRQLGVEENFGYDEEREFLIINLKNKCEQNNNYKVEIHYQGPIAETLYGFYRSSYTDPEGNKH
jgi:aminopeptidase N